MFSYVSLIAKDPVLTKVAIFAVFFAFGGACLSTVSAYTLSDLRWTQTEATLAFIGGGLVALILLLTKARVLFHDSAPSWPWWFLQASRHRGSR